VLNQAFFQVALPIMATFIATVWLASWSQNKRLDELGKRVDDGLAAVNRRLDDLTRRVEAIEADLKEFYRTLTNLDKRISRLEPGA
jgi:tetrahydromethanopterin S-methyltransferase subunit G